MTKQVDLLSGIYGRFVTGEMTKQDGTVRPVWGVFKNDPTVPAHLRVMYDMRVKQTFQYQPTFQRPQRGKGGR